MAAQVAGCVHECVNAKWSIAAWAQGPSDDRHLTDALTVVSRGDADILVVDHADVLGEETERVGKELAAAGAVLHTVADPPSSTPIPLSEQVARLRDLGMAEADIAYALGSDVATVRGMVPRQRVPRRRRGILLGLPIPLALGEAARKRLKWAAQVSAVGALVMAATMWPGGGSVVQPPAPDRPGAAPQQPEPAPPPSPKVTEAPVPPGRLRTQPTQPGPSNTPRPSNPESSPPPGEPAPEPEIPVDPRDCLRIDRIAVDVGACLERIRDVLS